MRTRNRAKVAHELGYEFSGVSHLAESLGIGESVVRLVRCAKTWELISMCFPIKVAAIYNATAHLCGMTIHILGGRVCNDVASPLKRTAVNRSCKGVVDNKRHTMLMSHISKALYIEDVATRVRDGFTKESLGVRLECFLNFFVRSCWVDECTIYAKLLQGYTKEVEGTTIY